MKAASQIVIFGESPVTIEQITAIAEQRAKAQLNPSAEFKQRINAGHQVITQLLNEDGAVYGVTTGFGDSCTVEVPASLAHELPINLTRFHGCGLGDYFSLQETRAIIATRLCSLAQGFSGVSYALLEYLLALLEHDILPRIPKEGSVGASGDLTPLSYLAGTLIGEREVYFKGQVVTAEQAFTAVGLNLYTLKPKEALALMNGTAVMTALASLAWLKAEYLCKLAANITAMVCIAVNGNPFHFDETLFAVKPHAGQQRVASWMRQALQGTKATANPERLQDRYSLRCAPHIVGTLVDTLPFLRTAIENELNSANDNPIVDPESGRVLHGGHFYGGHIAMAMDTLKTQVANLADLHDRQMALLLDNKTNQGLPANLSGAQGQRSAINHGFKAVQIGCSAWTAEALKLTMPASVFSRSTECHNQDKVSMGTIAARDALRVIELTEQVMVASLLAAWQGVQLRNPDPLALGSSLHALLEFVSDNFNLVIEDRPLENELRAFIKLVQQRALPLS